MARAGGCGIAPSKCRNGSGPSPPTGVFFGNLDNRRHVHLHGVVGKGQTHTNKDYRSIRSGNSEYRQGWGVMDVLMAGILRLPNAPRWLAAKLPPKASARPA